MIYLYIVTDMEWEFIVQNRIIIKLSVYQFYVYLFMIYVLLSNVHLIE